VRTPDYCTPCFFSLCAIVQLYWFHLPVFSCSCSLMPVPTRRWLFDRIRSFCCIAVMPLIFSLYRNMTFVNIWWLLKELFWCFNFLSFGKGAIDTTNRKLKSCPEWTALRLCARSFAFSWTWYDTAFLGRPWVLWIRLWMITSSASPAASKHRPPALNHYINGFFRSPYFGDQESLRQFITCTVAPFKYKKAYNYLITRA